MSKFSLATRKNMRDYQEQKEINLARIASCTGKSEVVFEMDEHEVDAALDAKGYSGRLGEIIWSVRLGLLADRLEEFCTDELNLEVLLESWTSNKVTFVLDENCPNYQQCAVVDGNLQMTCKPSNIWTNIDQLCRQPSLESTL
eukprot:TRINITY_DN10274_c0_g1_i1.p1 TRINITY_DN10274_c0_g1~~TRINITY_DN10274_c0_g1_i1.p1  ORF type:complete len:143 (-),score=27.66 TRINITY_DN10274_c0_g1_i1:43-471(-)